MNLPVTVRSPVRLTAATLLLAFACPAQAAITDGLDRVYLFDGDATDSVGAYDGTASSGVSYTAGECGRAARFDGATGSVTLPTSPYGDFTLSVRFNVATNFYYERLLDFSSPNGASGAFYVTTSFGHSGILAIDGFGVGFNSPTPLTTNQWHHLVYTQDKGGAGWSAWLDGIRQGAGPENTRSFENIVGARWYLGKSNWPGEATFNGTIDEVAIWNRSLTATEIAEVQAVCLSTVLADSDSDGVLDSNDLCPGGDDGLDADTDGTADACDACPDDFFNDTDGDGSCDSDDDCALDAADDADGDGLCFDEERSGCDLDPLNDADGDGVCAPDDICEFDAQNDADGDGLCADEDDWDACDDRVDADGDATPDACDVCPDDYYNDTDGDGACDSEDVCPLDVADDSDSDGACDSEDVCPADPADDADSDGACGDVDPCPVDAQNDADGDGVCESSDNCGSVTNSNQSNFDGDEYGDACEPDADNDGVIDDSDNCRADANGDQADTDGDGEGNACDADDDDDGVNDSVDTCTGTPAGTPVASSGCSVDQTCPTTGTWKNHGAYVSCVSRAAGTLVGEGVLTPAQKDAIVSAAGRSRVGSK